MMMTLRKHPPARLSMNLNPKIAQRMPIRRVSQSGTEHRHSLCSRPLIHFLDDDDLAPEGYYARIIPQFCECSTACKAVASLNG